MEQERMLFNLCSSKLKDEGAVLAILCRHCEEPYIQGHYALLHKDSKTFASRMKTVTCPHCGANGLPDVLLFSSRKEVQSFITEDIFIPDKYCLIPQQRIAFVSIVLQ